MPPRFSGTIVSVDLNNTEHSGALLDLLNEYSQDPMGDGAPLPEDVRENLIPRLRGVPAFRGLLAESHGKWVGVAVCFVGFSTFQARPRLNIHDLAVSPGHRGQGVGEALLKAIDRLAEAEGCLTVTLEVRADNPARRLYLRHGFEAGDPATDAMAFWKKRLRPGRAN